MFWDVFVLLVSDGPYVAWLKDLFHHFSGLKTISRRSTGNCSGKKKCCQCRKIEQCLLVLNVNFSNSTSEMKKYPLYNNQYYTFQFEAPYRKTHGNGSTITLAP